MHHAIKITVVNICVQQRSCESTNRRYWNGSVRLDWPLEGLKSAVTLKQASELQCVKIRVGGMPVRSGKLSPLRLCSQFWKYVWTQELRYRKQIACQLHTQYVEGIYDNTVTLTF